MAQLLPMTLSGDTLGQRHRYLNAQVNQASTDAVPFQDVEDQPEQAPVDRLFKIDLANKLQNVDYILKNIKSDDMLFVSRALKCKWLLNRRDIINPEYLEDILYPEMVMPAISKMKHWLYINLRNPLTCQEFYEYYKDKKFEYAVRFLNQCNNEFLLNEFPNIMTKVTPHYLKVLGQKCPQLVKIYYDSMSTNNDLIKRYLAQEQVFYNNIKYLLKLEPDMFLDITEKYHSLTSYNMLSPSATEYILRFHKSRFIAKTELYVAHLLHMRTVAQCLSEEECQEVVIKLARADYLKWWFSYENVEPLVKRVNPTKRAAFKKRVFVEKDVGATLAEWPYALPASPVALDVSFEGPHVFEDREFEPILMKRKIMKKTGRKNEVCEIYCEDYCESVVKSELQKLFDEFRFVGFEGTLHELKERIRATSSPDRRRDMLLVLVSKSGGRTEALRTLLQLALSLQNEPVHIRAAIVRSLVKRASVWRLPQDVWDTMLTYARGLGLDGTKPEAECLEGLHAAVMRQLIATGNCEKTLHDAFLKDFSTFTEYKLLQNERVKLGAGLQNTLVQAAADADPKVAANYLNLLLDVLQQYNIRFESSPAVAAVIALAECNLEIAKPLLNRLYNARVGRRELLRQYLKIQQGDAALLNALRHDPAAVTPQWLVELLVKNKTRANRFLLKLALYFTEKGGLVEQIRQLLLEKIAQKPYEKLARPLTMLAGGDMCTIMHDLDVTAGERSKLAAALRANMHLARPAPDALALGWRKAGMKAIAWRAMHCRPAQVTQLAQSLLEEKVKRTVRLALILAQRTACAADMFSKAFKIRPLATLRSALLYFRSFGDRADLRIWDIVKSLISDLNLNLYKGLHSILKKVHHIPRTIKPDYCALLYLNIEGKFSVFADNVFYELNTLLPEVSNNLLECFIIRMLGKLDADNPQSFPAIFIRYLMLSENENELKLRLEKFGEPLLNKLDDFRNGKLPSRPHFLPKNYDQIMQSLQFNFAFFNIKYECCLAVIERVLTWMETFMPRETYFGDYVKIHATMLYYKAVRQSMKQRPEVFEDPIKRNREGVQIVGFIFGQYIAKEATEVISKYFDSVIDIYRDALVDYFNVYFQLGNCREKFIEAVIKGILSDSVSRETRLAVHVLKECQYNTESPAGEELKELIGKCEDKETQFYLHAEIFA